MKIKEVSEKSGLPINTLRYYEKLGLFSPQKSTNGYRDYNEEDCEWITCIKVLRNAGMTISEVIKFTNLSRQGVTTVAVRRNMVTDYLYQLTNKMTELQKILDSSFG